MRLLLFFTLVTTLFYQQNSWAISDDFYPPYEVLEVDSIKQCATENFLSYAHLTHDQLNDSTLSFDVFKEGLIGYYNLLEENKIQRRDTLTIVDFSKPSNEERFFVIDLANRKVMHKTIVAHGVNSGRLYAEAFSNEANSKKSSLGFYVTTTTYTGKYDLALRIDGQEPTNSHASSRGVVIHAAKYATYEFLERNGGMLGRSFGCPALPYKKFDQIVEWIKGGSCLYIYHPSASYHKRSTYLNKKNYLLNFVYEGEQS